MKQDRFLIGILVGIGALIVVALALFFMRKDTREYVAEDVPEGVAYNYALAVLNKDYQKAYTYLADLEHKPTYEEFRQSFFNGQVNPGNVGLDIGQAEINGDEAIVGVTLVYPPSDPFSSRYESHENALLVKQNGAWKVSSMPYSFWNYSWYQQPIKP